MKMKPLTEFCALNMGQSPSSETYNDENVGLPFFQGNADFGEVHPKVRIWCSSPVKVAAAGDILISVRAPIGAMNIANTPCCIGRGLAALSPNPGTCVQEYLYYALQSRIDSLIAQGTGSTFKAIGKKTLEDTQIPAYSLDEQQIITDTLSETDQLITKTKAQVSLLDQLVKSRFVEMFGDPENNPKHWDKTSLSNVISNANNGMARRGNDAEGSIVLRLVELQDGFIDYSSPNRIVLSEAEKKRYLLKNRDFLFARVNGNPENVGRCAEFSDIGEPVYHNDHIIRVHFDENLISGCFASALLNSAYGKRQMAGQIKTSAGQYTINQEGIGAIVTVLPPLELQNRFAAFVTEVDKSKFRIQKSLSTSRKLWTMAQIDAIMNMDFSTQRSL